MVNGRRTKLTVGDMLVVNGDAVGTVVDEVVEVVNVQ